MNNNQSRKLILYVDDDQINIAVARSGLEARGYTVHGVRSGREGLDFAQQTPPDMILLDINMPEMDGYAVCETFKADPQLSDIPIIFVSARHDAKEKLRGFELGAVDYVTKPIEFREFLARVELHLKIAQHQREIQALNAENEQHIEQLNHEIIQRQQVEILLRDHADALQERNDELDAFARTVAHDLKNPLALVLSYANMLEEEQATLSTDECSLFAREIREAAQSMFHIIDELLLLAELRDAETIAEAINMADVVARAQKRLAMHIEHAQAEIILPDEWPAARGYSPWVVEVWANYLSNALKYGGEPPWIELGWTSYDDLIEFWISDNGQGLTEDEQARLFIPFTRLDEIRAQGHGLGLSIVRRIIEKLNGTVGVRSTVGEGSTFYFTLPEA